MRKAPTSGSYWKQLLYYKKLVYFVAIALLGGLIFPDTGMAQRPDRHNAPEYNRSNGHENKRPNREGRRSSEATPDRAHQSSYYRPEPSRQPSYQPGRQNSRELAYGGRRDYRYRGTPRPTQPYYAPNRDRSPAWHYRNLPRRGYSVPMAPARSINIAFGGLYFHYDNGVYYRSMHGRYVVVPAPFGLRTRVIPTGHLRFYVNQRPYYYYYGTYYVPQNGYYEVVKPPVGALVESIPDGYEQMVLDGETYYLVDGVQYKPVLHNNEIWYEVLKVD
ncbi:DUF6515 family protein [Adhaeribacter pallidiroseus]|uniref:Uncharacterized protein n=1 Tax=Adhaeribacter pallidiroseus TaxID=2072847 RepID=A0A369QBT8_9BACT|nr:DUF6515 family protein [Adhaeribacter pallidiroseus]RDC62361.1 hypothetical protein AHMF7616_00954 [Adhaeribacter pallidiroseus]